MYDIEKLKNSNSKLFTSHFAVARTLAMLPASFYSRSDERPKGNFCFGAYEGFFFDALKRCFEFGKIDMDPENEI